MVQLSELVTKASELRLLNEQIATRENELQLMKQRASKLSEQEIPEMMDRIGIKEFKLSGDFTVKVKPFYFGKVQGEEGFAWLREEGYGDIVKAKLEIPFDFTKPEYLTKLRTFCEDNGFIWVEKKDVHHMTMGAFLKEQIKAGVHFPEDRVKVYPGRRTYIS